MRRTLTAPIALLILGCMAFAAKADVTVYRGSVAEIIKTDATEPVIRRGSPGMRAGFAKPATEPRPIRVAAGRTLWLVDREAITACTVRSSGIVGRRKLICTQHQ